MACLARACATTAPRGQLGGQGERSLVELLAGHDLVDEADAQRLVGVHLPTGEDQLLGPARPDQAGQALGAAAAGDDAEQDLGLAELGPLDAIRKSQARASSQPPPRA